MASSALDALSAALFPARCLGCGRRGVALCEPCAATLPYLPNAVCPRCALPRTSRPSCSGCRHLAPELAGVRAVCAYEGIARKAVHALKFRSGRYLAPLMGGLLGQAAARRPLRADLVVPVPLTPGRMRDRGYNQAELLARAVMDEVGGTLAPHLLWREERPPQHTLAAAARRANAAHAVHCADPPSVAGVRVVLVDDVLTTGATLGACAQALTAAGANHVSALVFARDL